MLEVIIKMNKPRKGTYVGNSLYIVVSKNGKIITTESDLREARLWLQKPGDYIYKKTDASYQKYVF